MELQNIGSGNGETIFWEMRKQKKSGWNTKILGGRWDIVFIFSFLFITKTDNAFVVYFRKSFGVSRYF